ncbi:MAG TPA: hypothetical protein VD838_21310, partial [Anaeromyxobacteraceae bacterium]|nr:hypothetical protein [Anaeromyxobacteraceae bacterium]
MLARLTIAQKTFAGFLVAIAFAGALAVSSYLSSSTVTGRLTRMSQVTMPSFNAVDKLTSAQTLVWGATNGVASPELMDHGYAEHMLRETGNGWRLVEEGRREYGALTVSEEERALWTGMGPAWDAWEKPTKEVERLARERQDLISTGVAPEDPRVHALEERTRAMLAESQRAGLDIYGR